MHDERAMKPTDSVIAVEPEQAPGSQEAGEWHRLRQLLFGTEQKSLNALSAKIGDRDSLARSVAGVLPEAIALRAQHDDRISQVLAPVVEESLQQSVRVNPQPLVDALFPIMGPAIRRSIAEALTDMMRTFNRAVEESLSPRALKWRFDAWRTGQSYASVVLLHTLVYRVEQIFLIHRETGLLLRHAQADQVVVQDPDMVSGMLTAIRDFVGDSFQVNRDDGVDAIRLGDVSVQVRVGPRAILAAVVRGDPPDTLRVLLSETLERIHRSHALALKRFDGKSAAFASVDQSLRTCLTAQSRVKAGAPWRAYALLGLIAALMAAWVSARHQATNHWNEILRQLEHEPGLVVLDSSRASPSHVRGLRDPLARDPRDVIGAERLRHYDIIWDWKPYLSMDPPILLRRAQQLLMPPPEIVLRVDGDTLRASGVAPDSWLREARSRATLIPGVRVFDDAAAVSKGQRDLTQARDALNSAALYFEPGSDLLSDEQRAKLVALLPSVIALRDYAEAQQVEYSIELIGRADAPGTTEINLRLSQGRADAVRQYLIGHGLPGQHVSARGIGAIEAASAETIDAQEASHGSLDKERRVNFRVLLAPAGRPMAPPP
jgi:outer membrane protein OmpA-like peptidoglycan-associated protein